MLDDLSKLEQQISCVYDIKTLLKYLSVLHKNKCSGCSLEAFWQGASIENPQLDFYGEISKIIASFNITKYTAYLLSLKTISYQLTSSYMVLHLKE